MTPAVVALARVLPDNQVDDAIQLLNEDDIATFQLYGEQIADLVLDVRPLASDIEAHQVSAMLEKGAHARKVLEALRDARVRPLNEEVKAVNALFSTVRDQVDAFRKRAESLLTAWRRQEQARQQAAEEAARKEQEAVLAREAEARAAAEKAATPEERGEALAVADAALTESVQLEISAPRVVPRTLKTAGGGSTSFREVFDLVSVDYDLVPAEYWRRPKVIEAVKDELRKAIRGGARVIAGCVISSDEKLTVRG